MLNVLPGLTGLFVSRHLKVSYSASVELSWLAFWRGLRLNREVSAQPKEAGRRSIILRDGGLSIRLERLHDHLDLWILHDGRAPKVTRDLTDMREVLEKVRTTAENYQRPRRLWWAVVPTDQYQFTKFL
jgi:hypothetical protein